MEPCQASRPQARIGIAPTKWRASPIGPTPASLTPSDAAPTYSVQLGMTGTPSPASSSVHAHHSPSGSSAGGSSSSSARSPTAPYKRPTYTPDGTRKPRKRKGKNIDRLRNQYSLDDRSHDSAQQTGYDDEGMEEGEEPGGGRGGEVGLIPAGGELSRTSTAGQLLNLELAAALSWHLVSVARQTIQSSNYPNWKDLSAALGNLQDRLRNPSQTTDVVIACLVAVGSRRSHHSAITGQMTETEHLDPAALYKLQLGRKREGACRSLVDRAINLAETNGVLANSNADSIEALSYLRLMMMAVTPRHPRLLEMVQIAGKHYRAVPEWTDSAQSYVASDAATALLFDQPLGVADDELEMFGWPGLDVVSLKQQLDSLPYGSILDPEVFDKMRSMTVATMRFLATLRAQGWHKNNPDPLPVPARPLFESIAHLIWVCESAVVAVQGAPISSDESRSHHLQKNLHILKLPLVFNSGARKLAQQLVASGCDPENADAILEEVTVRYLRWVKRFMQCLAASITTNVDGYHQALLVEMLEIVPDWYKLTTEAARQHAKGFGPLADVGLSWSDLRKFHVCLQRSTAVFGSCVEREQHLAAELAALDLADDAAAHDARLVALMPKRKEYQCDMANDMVARALFELAQ